MKLRGRVPVRVLAAVVAGGVVVAAGIALLLGNIVHLRTTSDRTIQSDAYLVRTMEVEKLVVDAETGLRGYVITGNPSFLEPLRQAQQRIGRASSRLAQAATAENAFVPDALGLNRSAQSYLSSYVPQVVNEVRTDPGRARSTATTLRGKQLVDAIRSQTSQLEQQLAARLDARQRTAHSSANRAITLAIVMLVGLTLLTIALGALLARLFQARESARERAAFLAEAGTQLDRLVTGEDVLREFIRLSEERGAELCIAEESAAGDGARGALTSVGPGDVDPALRTALSSAEAEAAAARARDHADERGVTEAEGVTVGSGADAVHVLAVAAVARETVVSRALVVRRDHAWQREEIAELVGLGTRLALSLHARRLQAETAMLYRRSEYTVRTLQQSLLPRSIPEIPGCEVAVRFVPGTQGDLVGGDFYDVFAVGEDRWAVVIGDVCGKGPEAAAVTAMVRWSLRTLAESASSPGDALRRLNDSMLRQDLGSRFITIAYASIDVGPNAAEVTVACAGHPPPVVVGADGVPSTIGARGDLLGVWRDVELHEQTISLGPDARVLLYTDGVTDQGPGPERSVEMALRDVSPGATAAALAGELERQAHRWSMESRDDIAIVALRYEGGIGSNGDSPRERAAASQAVHSAGRLRSASSSVSRPPWSSMRRAWARARDRRPVG